MKRPTHGWCPACAEDSAIDAEGRCLWCEGATMPEKPKKRGGGKPAGKWGYLTDAQLTLLHNLHHDEGLSTRELGQRIWRKAGFASAHSAANSISAGWKRLNLPALSRQEMTARANVARRADDSPGTGDRKAYKRHLREKGGGYRVCAGVKLQAPGKGQPCSRFAMVGSDYCIGHDPERRAEVVTRAAAMRERLGVNA
jgi:hypothetical protein